MEASTRIPSATDTMPTTNTLPAPTLAESSLQITKGPRAKHNSSHRLNPILIGGDRRSRKKKSKVSWQSDEKIHKVHYFEYIADERINVTRMNNADQQNDTNASANNAGGFSLNANNKVSNAVGGKISNASVDPVRRFSSSKGPDFERVIEYSLWRPLIPLDFTPELQSPGWNSIERSAQAERETYVLGAIDLPGQPSILDEPDQPPKIGQSNEFYPSSASSASDSVLTIPADNVAGSFTTYNNMYDVGQPMPDLSQYFIYTNTYLYLPNCL